jgi:hypothetical protein
MTAVRWYQSPRIRSCTILCLAVSSCFSSNGSFSGICVAPLSSARIFHSRFVIRGEDANLLSLGAVDFGIIVDSAVILVENIFRNFQAKFEREIAGERIRDKIAASKKKGMWMGGNVPLVKDRKLIVNEPEAATARLIFRRYAELGSVALLKAELYLRVTGVSRSSSGSTTRCARILRR